MLEKNDKALGRDEAMHILMDSLIENCQVDDLPFVWALLQTIDKWDHNKDSNDHALSKIYQTFFKRVAGSPDEIFIKSCYEQVLYLYTVEFGLPRKIEKINQVLDESGGHFVFLVRPIAPASPGGGTPSPTDPTHSPTDQDDPGNPKQPRDKGAKMDPLTLSSKSIEEIAALLASLNLSSRRKALGYQWIKLYEAVVERFKDRLTGLAPAEEHIGNQANYRLKRSLVASLRETVKRDTVGRRQIIQALNNPIEEAKLAISHELPALLNENDITSLTNLVNQTANKAVYEMQQTRYRTEREMLLELIDVFPINRVNELAPLVRKYMGDDTAVQAFLSLSKRLLPYNREQAKDFLKAAFEASYKIAHIEERWYDELIPYSYDVMPQEANHRLLKSFYYWHVDRAYDIPYLIYKRIVPFADRLNEPGFFESLYDSNYRFNEKLAEGLPPSNVDDTFIRDYSVSPGLKPGIFKYLIDLFDYPLVGVRQLALGSLTQLYPLITEDIASFAKNELPSREPNSIEHFLVMLQSAAIAGNDISSILVSLRPLFDIEHFNIRQGLVELIEYVKKSGKDVPADLANHASRANKIPVIDRPTIIRQIIPAQPFVLSTYQADLIKELDDNPAPPFEDELYTELTSHGVDLSGLRIEEIQTHQHFNKGYYSEPLEINGPLFKEVQRGINNLLVKRIDRKYYSAEDISSFKYSFRLYDPSAIGKMLSPVPSFINWLKHDPDPTSFMTFADFEELLENFISREQDRMTVFESGEIERFTSNGRFATKVEASVIFADRGIDLSPLRTYLSEYVGFLRRENLYDHEVPELYSEVPIRVKKRDLFYPLIGASKAQFRGRPGITTALVIPAIEDLIHGEPHFQQWAGPFNDFVRPMQPSALGCTLTLDINAVRQYAEHLGADVYLCVHLDRQFRPSGETNPEWDTQSAVALKSLLLG
jgi:hypothetical protein